MRYVASMVACISLPGSFPVLFHRQLVLMMNRARRRKADHPIESSDDMVKKIKLSTSEEKQQIGDINHSIFGHSGLPHKTTNRTRVSGKLFVLDQLKRPRGFNSMDEESVSKRNKIINYCQKPHRTSKRPRQRYQRHNEDYQRQSYQGQRDKGQRENDKITRTRSNNKNNISEFVWDRNAMEIVIHKDAIQIARDDKTVECVHNFLRSHVTCSDISYMAIFLRILSNIVSIRSYSPHDSDRATELIEYLKLFSNECISFWGGLAIIVRKLPSLELDCARNFVKQLCQLMEVFLDHDREDTLIQNAIHFLPLDELHGALKQLSDQDIDGYKKTLEKVGDFLYTRDTHREALAQANVTQEKPHQDNDHNGFVFNVILQPSNLNYSGLSPDLKPNKIIGCYESKSEYLKTHFELMKEDFVYPLRTALHSFRDAGNISHDRNKNYYSYSNVSLVGKDISNFALVYKLQFRISKNSSINRQIDWEHNKRFTFGSLICLSEDQFETKIFASVAERKLADLKENIISVRLVDDQSNFISQQIQAKTFYDMIESPAYLEAYAPVLKRLNTLIENPDEMVFEKYFINCGSIVSNPVYLNVEDTPRTLNLSSVVCDCKKLSKCEHYNYTDVDVTKDNFWSELESPILDASQKKALQLALTHEVALIQGPPGTGKTFIGLKFVEVLLRNRDIYTSMSHLKQPIIIMCYTNHALDQFLEGIVRLRRDKEIQIDIVRVGGRCKSDILNKFTLHEKLIEARKDQKSYKKQRRFLVRSELPGIQARREALVDLCQTKNYYPINEALYFSFLHPNELQQTEYEPLLNAMRIRWPDLRSILDWFNIKTKQKTEKKSKSRYNEHQAIEDDRNTKNERTSKGSEVIEMAANHRKDLRSMFKELQSIQPKEHQHCQVRQHKLELFKYCLQERLVELESELSEFIKKKELVDEEQQRLRIDILKRADVIGFTTTGASSLNKVLTEVRSKIVIVEEAAEIMEAHVISALTKHTQHLVMIGDHKQLRPKAYDYTIGTKYGLEISLFERLIKNNFPYATLNEQHRMRPEISKLLYPHIYSELIDHDSVKEYPSIKGVANSIFFINHHEKETENESLKSPSNKHEALFLSSLCQYLLKQGYKPTEITVLTPYTGQVACLKEQFIRLKIDDDVAIVPVDSYQGEENDIILLSLVRSEKPGFVKDENRVCVALSRAKKGFYCIGNFDLFAKNSKVWNSIVSSLYERKLIGHQLTLKCGPHEDLNMVSHAEHFKKVPEGGCSKVCGVRRPQCGHICSRRCHPYNSNEEYHPGECTKPCIKMCKADLHQCKLKCYEDCRCNEIVEKLMTKCNHKELMRCDVDPNYYVCTKPCEKYLKCGHLCRNKCGVNCDIKKCMFMLNEILPCGHQAQRKCSETSLERMEYCRIKCDKELDCGHKCKGNCGSCNQGRLHLPCVEKCGRQLPCGHICTARCSQTCPPCKEQCPVSCSHGKCGHTCGTQSCIECAEPCQWQCYHYKCNKLCGAICDRERCNIPCQRNLPCHHRCMGLCMEKCPKVCRRCDPHNDAFQIFFGSEEDNDARFIQLNDCGHVFEYKDLDKYMDSDSDAIEFKKCPKCTRFIHNPPKRYCNVIKKIKQDMNSIKKKKNTIFAKEERKEVIRLITEMGDEKGYFTVAFKRESLEKYNDCVLQKHHIILCALSINHSYADVAIESVGSPSPLYKVNEEYFLSLNVEYKRVKWQLVRLHQFVNSRQLKILYQLPIQILNDVQRETSRLSLLFKCYNIVGNVVTQDVDLSDDDDDLLYSLMNESLNHENFKPCGFQIDQEEEYSRILQNIKETYGVIGISEEETKMVIKAIDDKKGSWYKCPQGHLYNISQCGGAMEEGTCPECGSSVGGTDHQLLDSNSTTMQDDGQNSSLNYSL